VEYQNGMSFYLWKVRKQVEQDKFCMSTQKEPNKKLMANDEDRWPLD
jgi:hypothetical protein